MGRQSGEHPLFRQLEQASARYRAARSAAHFFVFLVRFATPGLVVTIALLFLSKLFWPPLFWAVALAPAWLVAVAVYLSVRPQRWREPSWRAAALADVRSGNRGVFMALVEADGAAWADALSDRAPQLKYGVPRAAALTALLLAAAFVALLLAPDLGPAARTRRHTPAPVARMTELVKLLEGSQLADRDYLEKTKDLLNEIKENGSAVLGPDDLQALDKCREELQKQAVNSLQNIGQTRQTIEQLSNKLDSNDGLDALAHSRLKELLDKTTPKDLNDLKAALEKQRELKQLTKEELDKLNGCLDQSRLRELLDRLKDPQSRLSPEEAKALKALLEQMDGDLSDSARKALEALGAEPGDGDLAGLMGADGSEGGATGADGAGLPGQGGVDRGPGPAPLNHIGNTSDKFGKFAAETFRGGAGDLDAALGYSTTKPDPADTKPVGPVQPGALRQFGSGDERLAWRSRLLPRHNDTLKNYFRPDEGKSP